MNNKEAIHKLEYMRNAYQKLIDEKVDEGRLVGPDITGTWKADTPLNDAYKEHIEALDLAITALEQQEPMKGKWIKHEHGYWSYVNEHGERDGLHIKQGDQGASNLHLSGYVGLTESENSYGHD